MDRVGLEISNFYNFINKHVARIARISFLFVYDSYLENKFQYKDTTFKWSSSHIWWTCSRSNMLNKIVWCFPKKVCTLGPLEGRKMIRLVWILFYPLNCVTGSRFIFVNANQTHNYHHQQSWVLRQKWV